MRRLNLRQVEVFRAVVQHGTVSAAALALHVSQPAMSKSLAQFEAGTGLRLFDRVKGRLAPTEQGMRLYAEVERIFGGVGQVERAVEALHRQAQRRLRIGVMPALSGRFVQRAVTAFLRLHPGTNCIVEGRSSEWITESLVGRRLDVGLVGGDMRSPYLHSEPMAEEPLVCIMPAGHALAGRAVVRPADLDGISYVSLDPDTAGGQAIWNLLSARGVAPAVAVMTNLARTACEFVAAGTGVSLVHPLITGDFEGVVARPFEVPITSGFLVSHGRAGRDARLVEDFVRAALATAAAMLGEVRAGTPEGA